MKKWLVIFPFLMVFLAQTAYSYETYPYKNQALLLINCGATNWEYHENWSWAPDNGYINTGGEKLIDPKINVPGYMKSLRFFPHGDKNCYKVFLDPKYLFLFRAGFYYGNYDGRSKPPTFDLYIDGGFWATVNTSASDQGPVFHEILYKPKGESTSVCLVRTHHSEVPFISSLVMAYLHDNGAKPVYKLMGTNTALHLVSRTTFGGLDKAINPWTWSTCEEYSYRIWQQKSMPSYLNISFIVNNDQFPGECLGFSYENRPPDSLLKNAITPANASDSIFVQVDFRNNTQQSAYFVFYFLDYTLKIYQNPNFTRKFEIHIDGALKNVVELNDAEFGQAVTLYPVEVSGIANVTISPFSGSELPPILNGMEVYTASEIVASKGGFKLLFSDVSQLFLNVVSLLVLFV